MLNLKQDWTESIVLQTEEEVRGDMEVVKKEIQFLQCC